MTVYENSSALVQLYQDTKIYVAGKNAGTQVLFGRKERWLQINEGSNGANRITFIPGREPGGDAGEIAGADGPGEQVGASGNLLAPRVLFLHQKIATVSVWAADVTNDPSGSVDETAQEQAIEQMFEWVLRATKRSIAGAANIEWKALRYNPSPTERRYGIEFLAELIIGTQYFDDAAGVVQPSGATVSRGTIS